MKAFLGIVRTARALLRRPVVAAGFGACAAVALPHMYRAAGNWWALRSALVVVDGQMIQRADLERELTRRGLSAQALSHMGKSVLDDMVELEMLAAAAKRAGYAEDAEVRRDIKHALAGRYRTATIEKPLGEVSVGNPEIAAYYKANPQQFTLPEAAHAAIIFLAAPATTREERRRDTMVKAEQLRQEAMAQPAASDFGTLAVRHSDDQASRYRGGDVGWMAKGQTDSRLEPAVLAAVFALERPGEIAPVVSTEEGFYLVKLLEKKPERVRPLRKVAEEIRARLLRAERAARERELRQRAVGEVEVRVNESQIAALGLDADGAPARDVKAPQDLLAKR